MDWTDVAHVKESWQALVNAVVILRVPSVAANFLSSCKQVSFS